MEHKHNIIDTDVRFLIDSIHRRIKSESKKITLMQNDHNSERYSFELPRYIEGHDMTLCNKVEVHYLNTATKEKEKGKVATGKYDVDDLQISPEDESKVLFSWLISKNATKYAGVLSFRIKFRCIEDDIETYSWNTDIYADIKINDGINADETFEIEYVDIIEQWKAAVKSEFSAEIDDLGESLKTELSEWEELESGKIRGEMTAYSAQWNQALSVERERIDNIVALPEGSTTGDAELLDIRVGADGVTYDSAGTAVREQFKNVYGEIEQIALFSENLFDKGAEGILFGWYVNVEGEEHEAKDMFTSDFIPVQYGKTYSVFVARTFFGANANKIVSYGASKEIIGYLSGNTENDILTFTVNNQNVKYVRFSQYTNQLGMLMFMEGNTLPEQYVPYKHTLKDAFALNERQIAEVKAEIIAQFNENNPLFGKSIALNGDSICKGSEDGSNYGEIIAERNGMTLTNVAVAGGTITAETYHSSTGDNRHWICRTIDKMPSDADFAIVEGGVNDASLKVPLGSLTSGFKTALDETTFYGAFESMLRQVVIRFAGKKYGYIAVHKMSDLYGSEDPVETSYYHAARLCCQKWGVPFLDLNVSVPPFAYFTLGSGKDLYTLREAYTLNADGWHPNKQGYEKYYCDKIESWLKTL